MQCVVMNHLMYDVFFLEVSKWPFFLSANRLKSFKQRKEEHKN